MNQTDLKLKRVYLCVYETNTKSTTNFFFHHRLLHVARMGGSQGFVISVTCHLLSSPSVSMHDTVRGAYRILPPAQAQYL